MGVINFFPMGGGGGKDISEAVVTLGNALTYTGNVQTQSVSSVVLNGVTLTEGTDYALIGNTGKDVGNYSMTILGINDYSGYVTQAWSISKASITKPTVSVGSYTYNGSAQGPTITGFDADTMTKTGDSEADAGSYTLDIALKDSTNMEWSDQTTADITASWSIAKATPTVTAPTANSPTYDGTAQALVSAGSTTGGELQYSTDGVNYSASIPTGTNAGNYTVYYKVVGGTNYNDVAAATVSATLAKAQGNISVSPSSMSLTGVAGATGTATITVTGDGNVSVGSSDVGVATASVSGTIVTVTAVDDGTATITITLADGTNYLGGTCTISVSVTLTHIYGVLWDKTSTTALTRTDDAALFSDPTPAIGTGSGSSPFDTRMPWSGMVKEVIGDDTFVKIPKFWYKITDDSNGLKIQIANEAVSGFSVSPGHADRGDGSGERDYIYVGRYHCDSNYKSKAGSKPKASITRSAARSGIHNRNSKYWQLDYATLWTIRMLYLVEFADWNAQKVIGYGCGDGSETGNMGYTDSMTYHTGTTRANRTTYGLGTQYRWIEGLWDNVRDWVDGIVLSSRAAYVCTNPANFADSTTGHTKVANGPSSDLNACIKSWEVPTASGLDWALFPKTSVSDSNYATYVADYAHVYSSYVVVYVGGNYNQVQYSGMFYANSYTSSYSNGYVGARIQYLPKRGNPKGDRNPPLGVISRYALRITRIHNPLPGGEQTGSAVQCTGAGRCASRTTRTSTRRTSWSTLAGTITRTRTTACSTPTATRRRTPTATSVPVSLYKHEQHSRIKPQGFNHTAQPFAHPMVKILPTGHGFVGKPSAREVTRSE